MTISEKFYSALVIVLELITHYESQGVSIQHISEHHHIPIDVLRPVVEQLRKIGIVKLKCDKNKITLNINPMGILVCDAGMLLDGARFSGQFVDSQTGELVSQSNMRRID